MSTPAAASPWSRKNPFPAPLRVNRSLCAPGLGKDTRHYEVSIAGSGLSYEVGDSLGIFPQNDPALVEEMLRVLGFTGEEAVVTPDGHEVPVRRLLMRNCVITEPDKKLIAAVALKAGDTDLHSLATDPARKDALADYLWGREIIDLLLEYPQARFTPPEFAALLRKLQPRLYSIASSPKAHPDEVHLCVATISYESLGRPRKGVCSTYLAERVPANEPVPVFFHTAKHFRLPEDGNAPVIMVGPGTGIAPFRAYLEERRATGAKGKNWLFFGSRQRTEDFLYGEELEAFHRDGLLNRLTLAFSRDQAHKIYVQHRMREEAAELWEWLEEGAYFYVCGDAKHMAKDVEEALVHVAEQAGSKSHEDALAYVQNLKTTKRYRKDVY